MSFIPGKFVWFEHQSADQAAAQRFHAALFGWRTNNVQMGERSYTLIVAGERPIGGYDGDLAAGPHWRAYLSVADVDAACATAASAGATVVEAPTNYGEVGRAAVLRDSAGAEVALWRASTGDPADDMNLPAGRFCWNELYADDPVAAVRFYEQVGGYSGHDTMDMGPQGNYYIVKTGTTGRAGIMAKPVPQQPSMWVPYVTVTDPDAIAAQARALGATVCVEPMDIPNVGRFAMFIDPTGVTTGVIRLTMPAS